MFFITYLRRELIRRRRQAIVIALGLALGVGLVITVIAASAGVKNAQAGVLRTLYGIGTAATVTQAAPPQSASGGKPTEGDISMGPSGPCKYNAAGVCVKLGTDTITNLSSPGYAPLSDSTVARVGRLRQVAGVAGGLSLTDTKIKLPKFSPTGGLAGGVPVPVSFAVEGVDLTHPDLGPLSAGKIKSGHGFTAADTTADAAVVDSDYAAANKISLGDDVTVSATKFKVIGIVSQPQGSNPPDVYVPLARAQSLGTYHGSDLKNEVNTLYVGVASASDVQAVQNEIHHLLPKSTVTSSADLASQVTGSLSSTAKLANDLGRWLSVLVLVAAFAVAALLTMAAVARRVREFGTLKALGWRSRRIIAQVMGESLTVGVLGGALGVGLGFAGAAIITAISPSLSAVLLTGTGLQFRSVTGAGASVTKPTVPHTVAVPMTASVTTDAIVAAVVLAVLGGLIAGAFGSWRIAQLRPAAALSRVD
jgi:putative ABC transport system permease protein